MARMNSRKRMTPTMVRIHIRGQSRELREGVVRAESGEDVSSILMAGMLVAGRRLHEYGEELNYKSEYSWYYDSLLRLQ
jgi:hypothetical protein